MKTTKLDEMRVGLWRTMMVMWSIAVQHCFAFVSRSRIHGQQGRIQGLAKNYENDGNAFPREFSHQRGPLQALSDQYLENDLVSVQVPYRLLVNSDKDGCRLCVVRPDNTVLPLCRHEDDVDTDLFMDPRTLDDSFWNDISDDVVRHSMATSLLSAMIAREIGWTKPATNGCFTSRRKTCASSC